MRRSPATAPGRRRTLSPHGMSPDLPGRGKTSGSGRLGRMCALRSAAFRKERCRLWEIPPRRRLIRAGCSRTLPQGAGERPAAVVRGECVLCPESHFERSASGKWQALFRTGIFPEPPAAGNGKTSGKAVRGECAPYAARHSERNGADRGKSLRGERRRVRKNGRFPKN